jgi:hypothetical protein
VTNRLLQLEAKRWQNYPFGFTPRATIEKYQSLGQTLRDRSYPTVDAYEEKLGFRIDQTWLHNLALHTQVVIKESELCYQHGRVLYSTLSGYLRDVAGGPSVSCTRVFETGTARGFSAMCMAKALHDMQRDGIILTVDLLPHHKPMYWNCIDDHDCAKSRQELLAEWRALVDRYLIFFEGDSKLILPRIGIGRVHFAFLDGAHTYDDIWFEGRAILGKQESGDVTIFDDYDQDVFPGLVRGINEVCEEFGYHTEPVRATKIRQYLIARKQ